MIDASFERAQELDGGHRIRDDTTRLATPRKDVVVFQLENTDVVS